MDFYLTPNPQLRAKALIALRGKWIPAVLVTLVYLIITFGITEILKMIPIIGYETTYEGLDFQILMTESIKETFSPAYFLSLLVVLPLGFGVMISFLNLVRSAIDTKIADLFAGFKTYGKVLGTLILAYIYTFLWTLLLIIPGIIKNYSYAMTPYLLKDEPELGADDTIKKSIAMMDGNKMKLFLLDLSFLGWGFLTLLPFLIGSVLMPTYEPMSLLPLSIGILWVYPYYFSARAAFYEDIKNQQQVQA